jgi:CheY-like chemotaxis protein
MNMSKPHELILYVDDQQVARRYFSLMFSSRYIVLTAQDSDEAWTLIRKYGDQLAVIITDYRMPKHSGVDLLVAVRKAYPRIVRMLTTGYADLSEAVDAVNRGEIYAYIHKPWNIDDFGIDIRRAVEWHGLQKERDALFETQMATRLHALGAGRLQAYGLIAAACSGWLERPLVATLAFWSDHMRHFSRTMLQPDIKDYQGSGAELTCAILKRAADLSTWLASCQSITAPSVVDAASLVASAAEEFDCQVVASYTAVPMSLNPRLFKAGLCSWIDFLMSAAVKEGRCASVTIQCGPALSGGMDISIRVSTTALDEVVEARDQIAIECLGLRAYFVFHHHGGELVIKEWDLNSRVIAIHVPSTAPALRIDVAKDFLAEIVRNH